MTDSSFKGMKAEFVGGWLDGKVLEAGSHAIGTMVVTQSYDEIFDKTTLSFYKTELNEHEGYPIVYTLQGVKEYDDSDDEGEYDD